MLTNQIMKQRLNLRLFRQISAIQMRQIHITTAGTPNPHSMKYLPGRSVTGDANQTMDFSAAKYASISPLASRLFEIDGVTRVFFGKDFIAVTKEDELDWNDMKAEVMDLITDHYESKQPLFTEDLESEDDGLAPNDADSEALAMVKEIFLSRIKPFVQEDGGDICLLEFNEETGMVYVQLKGACAGCPSSTETLKNGIEKMLTFYVAEVTGVEQVEEQ